MPEVILVGEFKEVVPDIINPYSSSDSQKEYLAQENSRERC